MLFLKISLMGFALAGVFYSMRYLRSQEFAAKTQAADSPLAILLGTDGSKAYNWCPAPLESIAIHPKEPSMSQAKRLSTAVDWAAACEILMEPVLKADIEGNYRVLAMAFPKKGEPVYLEQNDKGVFRVLGTPFRSSSLAKALKRYEF